MNKKYRFYIAEETHDEDEGSSIIRKCVDMKFFKRIINRLLQSQFEELNNCIQDLTTSLTQEQSYKAKLEKEIQSIKSQIVSLQNTVNLTREKIDPLVAAYNVKKATSFARSKDALDELYKLNILFKQHVSYFGRAKKLDILQNLVKFLQNPSDDLEQALVSKSSDDEKAMSILSQIKRFNESHKSDLVNYLTSEKLEWNDCVFFPDSCLFDPEVMGLFNEEAEINVGESIYIVSIGLNFPNSNSEKQKPLVFKRNK